MRIPENDKTKTCFGLTNQEHLVVREVVFGFTDSEIAAKLKISEAIVRQYLAAIFDKTGVSTRLELAKLLLKHQAPRHG